jgi:hypothetical protein
MPLSQLVAGFEAIDYLDVDVEGHELEVLKGFDFSRVEIRVIGVEVAETGPMKDAIDSFLESNGFRPFLHLYSDRFYSYGSELPSAKRLCEFH